jgi:hypothetical protein
MDPSAFHQPPAKVPGGQALTPLLMVQQKSVYPLQHVEEQSQSVPGTHWQIWAYAVPGRTR